MNNKDTFKIEQDWLEKNILAPLGKLKRHEMKINTAQMFLVIGGITNTETEKMIKEMPYSQEVQLIKKRANVRLTVKLETKVILGVILCAEGMRGIGIMYLYYLQYWAKKHDFKEITWQDFSMRIFFNGFPSKKDLITLWDRQKKEIDGKICNMIDIPMASESIQLKK